MKSLFVAALGSYIIAAAYLVRGDTLWFVVWLFIALGGVMLGAKIEREPALTGREEAK